jgi:hypothetical protein
MHRAVSGKTDVEVNNPFQSYATSPVRTSSLEQHSPDTRLDTTNPGISNLTYIWPANTVYYPIGNSTFEETSTHTTPDVDAANKKRSNRRVSEVLFSTSIIFFLKKSGLL